MLTVYLLILQILAVVISVYIFITSISNLQLKRSIFFICLTICSIFYTMGIFLESTSESLNTLILANQIKYIGLVFVAPLLLLFFLDYYEYNIKSQVPLSALFIFPIIAIVSIVTWQFNGALIEDAVPLTIENFNLLHIKSNIIVNLNFTFMSILLICTTTLIFKQMTDEVKEKNRNDVTFLLGTILLLLTSLFYFTKASTGTLDFFFIALPLNLLILSKSILNFKNYNLESYVLDNVLENMDTPFVLIDEENRLVDSNKKFKIIFQSFESLMKGEDLSKIDKLPFFNNAELLPGLKFKLKQEDGVKYYKFEKKEIKIEKEVFYNCLMIKDVTDLNSITSDISDFANLDPLTKLYNRRLFFKLMDVELEKVKLINTSCSLLIIDIDSFNLVNTTHGYLFGDVILKSITKILKTRLRESDIIGRYAGEEFCVFLSSTVPDNAFLVGESIRKTIEESEFKYEDTVLKITVSIGVSGFEVNDFKHIKELLNEADAALYKAKKLGQNRVSL